MFFEKQSAIWISLMPDLVKSLTNEQAMAADIHKSSVFHRFLTIEAP